MSPLDDTAGEKALRVAFALLLLVFLGSIVGSCAAGTVWLWSVVL